MTAPRGAVEEYIARVAEIDFRAAAPEQSSAPRPIQRAEDRSDEEEGIEPYALQSGEEAGREDEAAAILAEGDAEADDALDLKRVFAEHDLQETGGRQQPRRDSPAPNVPSVMRDATPTPRAAGKSARVKPARPPVDHSISSATAASNSAWSILADYRKRAASPAPPSEKAAWDGNRVGDTFRSLAGGLSTSADEWVRKPVTWVAIVAAIFAFAFWYTDPRNPYFGPYATIKLAPNNPVVFDEDP
jgi:hypothetical protein